MGLIKGKELRPVWDELCQFGFEWDGKRSMSGPFVFERRWNAKETVRVTVDIDSPTHKVEVLVKRGCCYHATCTRLAPLDDVVTQALNIAR